MPKIIQFLHTSVEATPENSNESVIEWNNNKDHRRKFILSKGNVSITMFKKPNIGDNIIITPVLTSKGKLEEATFELIGESYMGGN